MPRKSAADRRVCFVTGTRAEFGLMESTLRAIQRTPGLRLQIVATGMHLDPRHGDGLGQIGSSGWRVNAVVPWPPARTPDAIAERTGAAIAGLAGAFVRLRSDIVLVVGDRVEAFAAATASHIAGRIVAHVHGGDRALGQVDDALRHAITKLAHLHFPATVESARRIARLGEDRWRIHRSGSPGLDGIRALASPRGSIARSFGVAPKRFALVALHPTDPDEATEERRAAMLLRGVRQSGIPQVVVIGPNNDPGADGILRAWHAAGSSIAFRPDVPRADFLGLLRDAGFLIGNSSSGIIEAASFGTPVIDVGDRQLGRERSENVRNVPFRQDDLRRAIAGVWRGGRLKVFPRRNVYGGSGAAARIARTIASVELHDRLRRKLISY
jgi:GDP/UDP-N,N'-diacetylbacillosamine 2-epimerase (hydrolysing)